jgi:hypothetical protein
MMIDTRQRNAAAAAAAGADAGALGTKQPRYEAVTRAMQTLEPCGDNSCSRPAQASRLQKKPVALSSMHVASGVESARGRKASSVF